MGTRVQMGGGSGPVDIPVAPGIDTFTSPPTVIGGETYQLQNSDVIVRADSSNGEAPILVMPNATYISEKHTIFWFAWNGAQVPPQIQAAANTKMTPVGGMSQSGAAGLVAQTACVTPGVGVTYEWDGSDWLQVS